MTSRSTELDPSTPPTCNFFGPTWPKLRNLPVNRRSVAPGPVGAVNIVSPLHLHKGLSRANEAMLAVVPPCAA